MLIICVNKFSPLSHTLWQRVIVKGPFMEPTYLSRYWASQTSAQQVAPQGPSKIPSPNCKQYMHAIALHLNFTPKGLLFPLTLFLPGSFSLSLFISQFLIFIWKYKKRFSNELNNENCFMPKQTEHKCQIVFRNSMHVKLFILLLLGTFLFIYI